MERKTKPPSMIIRLGLGLLAGLLALAVVKGIKSQSGGEKEPEMKKESMSDLPADLPEVPKLSDRSLQLLGEYREAMLEMEKVERPVRISKTITIVPTYGEGNSNYKKALELREKLREIRRFDPSPEMEAANKIDNWIKELVKTVPDAEWEKLSKKSLEEIIKP